MLRKVRREAESAAFTTLYPWFEQKPPTIREFVGPGYLEIDSKVRAGVLAALETTFGTKVDPHRIAPYERSMMTGAIGIGKGQLATDVVHTPFGERTIGSLVVGDEVVSSSGDSCTVTGVFPRGRLEVFRVVMNDGTSLVVDGDHLWSVSTSRGNEESASWGVASTSDLASGILFNSDGSFRWRVPTLSGPVLYAVTAGGRADPFEAGRSAAYGGIPTGVLHDVVADRVEFLRGVMDSCGSMVGGFVVADVPSLVFAEDLVRLVRSLAGSAQILGGDSWRGPGRRVTVSTPFNPFPPGHTADRWGRRPRPVPPRFIVAIEPAGHGDVVCIQVDSPDHLYLAGDDMVLSHNTTFASIALPYMVCWTACLRSPQEFYGLLPGSRIAFMIMSTSEKQAREVMFGDLVARISGSPWFREHCQRDEKIATKLIFPKDLWIVPGDSAETTFEGYNVLCGIIDEMDSHKSTDKKDYADTGYDAIASRVSSRFPDQRTDGHRGLIICIGQMKKANGFAARKYAEFSADPRSSVSRMTIWESFGWDMYTNDDGTRRAFLLDTKSKEIITRYADDEAETSGGRLVEVPEKYRTEFLTNPEKALRDLAGIPPATSDPFISLVDRIDSCVTRWGDSHGRPSPVSTSSSSPEFADWFRAAGDPRPRALHIDMGYSGDGDALGIAMGHVREMVEVEGDLKPVIVIDMLYRVQAPKGTEIYLPDVRNVVYEMVRRGFKISDVTLDGFQSKETMQALAKRRLRAGYLSVDRVTLPYEDLREAIYDERLEFPPYVTTLTRGDTTLLQVLPKELRELTFTGKKVDHPAGGSKDLADCVAGVVTTLAGSRSYARSATAAALAARRTPVGLVGRSSRPDSGGTKSFLGPASVRPASGDSIMSLLPPHLRGR